MADLRMCGHEKREHAYDPVESRPVCFGASMTCECARYTRSPLSAFRGPSARFAREEAAFWIDPLLGSYSAQHVYDTPEQIRTTVRMYVRQARWLIRKGASLEQATRLYIAARVMRATLQE